MARPHIEPYVELNDPFKKFDIAGFKGSHYKILSLDLDTGACTLKVRFDGGFRRKPGLSYSDVEIFVLNGEIRVGKNTWREGHYAYIPAGMALEALHVPQGAEALVMFNDSEPNFEESGESHELALTEAFTSLNGYEDVPWFGLGRVNPRVATGCLSKLLRQDPLTEATTFLYCMTPRSPRTISPTTTAPRRATTSGARPGCCSSANCRPAATSGGRRTSIMARSAASYGTIALGRTDSKLHNYFHYNPWTNPEENLRRAAAQIYRQRPLLHAWQVSEGHNHPDGPPDFQHPHYHDDAHVRDLHGDHPGTITRTRTAACDACAAQATRWQHVYLRCRYS